MLVIFIVCLRDQESGTDNPWEKHMIASSQTHSDPALYAGCGGGQMSGDCKRQSVNCLNTKVLMTPW